METKTGFAQYLDRLQFPITIEPIIFFYTVSVGLNEVIRSNLIIDKLCQSKFEYNATICDNLEDQVNKQYQDAVQVSVTEYESFYGTLAFIPRIIYGLLAGTWSDRNGRKVLIGLPILGQLLASLSYGINYFFLKELPWQLLYLEFGNELCGTYVAYYLAVYSYITDVSDEESRTFRLSLVDGLDYFSTSIGTLVSGPIFLAGGYYSVFGASTGSCIICFLLLIFWVKESLRKTEQDPSFEAGSTDNSAIDTTPNTNISADLWTPLQENDNDPRNYKTITGGSQPQLDQSSDIETHPERQKSFLVVGFLYIVESLRTVLKSREWPRRPILFLGVFNFAAFIFTYNGTEGTHRYLFAGNKYGWDEQEFTRYLFNYRVAYMVSLWVVAPILSRMLKIRDPIICIMACALSTIGFILPAVTASSTWFSVGSFVCMFSPLTTITTRSILSSIVPTHEIGRIYSVLALFSAASGSLVEAVFQWIYSETLTSFPGAYLLVNAGLFVITVPVSIAILILQNKVK